jgi:hypothetical protein
MAIVHVVLHKSNEATSPEFVAEWAKRGAEMKGASLAQVCDSVRKLKLVPFARQDPRLV